MPKVTTVLFLLCIILSISTWLGIFPARDPDIFSPRKMQELKGFNFTNDSISRTLAQNKISYGVIFIEDCDSNWWCYGSVFSKNTPTLDSPIIYLKDLGNQQNLTLEQYYKSKPFYKINYYTLKLTNIPK
jgi:hypothetical protein